MAVVGMEARKLRFPFVIETFANFGIRRIIIISIPFLGCFLEERVFHALRDQEVHRFLKAGDGAGDLGIFMSGQRPRNEANSLNSLQIIPSISNHERLSDHPL